MNSTMTVALARNYYQDLVPPDAKTGDDLFIKALNKGLQYLTNDGKFKGSMEYLAIKPTVNTVGTLSNGSDGYIVLPRWYLSVLSMRFGCIPMPTFSQWHEWVSSGPGFIDPNRETMGILTDEGDGWPSQRMIPPGTSASIQIGITNIADAGKTVRVFGIGADYTQIFDATARGYNLTTAYPMSAPNGQQVRILQGLQGPLVTQQPTYFVGSWSAWMNQNGVLTQIGEYEPTENIPCLHRYKIGNIIRFATGNPFAISILAQRRFVPVIAETDFVIPDDLSALEYVILGGNHDIALRHDKALQCYAMAVERLNSSARIARAGARVDAEMAQAFSNNGGYSGGWWGGSGSPNSI